MAPAVLIVDDDEDHRLVLDMLLQRAGVTDVRQAGNAAAGIARARERAPELVILDIEMPGRSGLDALPDLLDAAPDAVVVMLSHLDRRRHEASASRAGAVGYVEKSTPPDRLVGEIFAVAELAERLAEHLSTRLEAAPTAARAARVALRSTVPGLDHEVVEVAELLVSELVTNAVIHARSAPRLEIALGARSLRVEVFDDDPRLPEAREVDRDRLGGRGLLLLDRLSTRWGADATADGKVVWFELDRSGG